MSPVKEIHYFNDHDSNLNLDTKYHHKDLDWYRDHFRNCGSERAVGEATPMYLCDKKAPARISKHLPQVKLIACLRYPTDRAHSHYWMARGKEHTELTFREVVQGREKKFIERGRYGQQLERYLSHFSETQLLVLIHEELFANPVKHLNRICSFLDVEDTFYQDQSWITDAVNRSSTVRSTFLHEAIGAVATWMRHHEGFRQVLDAVKRSGVATLIKQGNRKQREYSEMPSALRHELDSYYAPTVQRVEAILGRQVDAWRQQTTVDIPTPAK